MHTSNVIPCNQQIAFVNLNMAVMIQHVVYNQHTSVSYVMQIADQTDCDGNCAHGYSQHVPTQSQLGNVPLRFAINTRKHLHAIYNQHCDLLQLANYIAITCQHMRERCFLQKNINILQLT